jgi:hypothetical protein
MRLELTPLYTPLYMPCYSALPSLHQELLRRWGLP